MKKLLLCVCFLLSLTMLSAQQQNTLDSLYGVLQKPIHDTIRVRTITSIAKIIRNKENVKALELAKEAYDISIRINYPYGMASSADFMGVVYLNLGDFRKALYYHFIALNIFEHIGNQRGIAFCYNNIGSVYSHLKNYSKAEVYHLKSLDIKLKNGLNKEASSSYVNLGNIRMYTNDISTCISYYNQALANARKYNDSVHITIALMNLGEAFNDIGKHSKALSYYYSILPIIRESGNRNHEAQAYFAIGKIYTTLKNYTAAESYLKKALSLCLLLKSQTLELNVYKYLTNLYETKKEYKEALFYNKLFIALNDSIFSSENSRNINEMQARYELEKKEEQIKALNQEKLIITAKETRETIIRNFFIIGFILISVIAFISFRSVARKQRTNRLLNIKNDQIEWQRVEIEKKNIALSEFNKELMKENMVARYETLKSKINPHFLFNSLSTLSSLIIQDPKTALEFVSKFSKLYRSIMEHGNGHLVTIQEEIEVVESFVYLKKMRYGDTLQLFIHIPRQHYSELIPPFALQLLVENATKHNIVSKAAPLTITITYRNNEIEVKNNYQPRSSPEPSTGLGQHSIIERYKLVTEAQPRFVIEDELYIAYIPSLNTSTGPNKV